jgi:hypothetical protein
VEREQGIMMRIKKIFDESQLSPNVSQCCIVWILSPKLRHGILIFHHQEMSAIRPQTAKRSQLLILELLWPTLIYLDVHFNILSFLQR